MPRVSVITPTYNCADYLEQALNSVAAQTYHDYEIIVVDDGSTDHTDRVVERWKGKIRYFSQSNSGPSAARNHGVAHSRGEFIAYLDADDLWYPAKLERQVAYLDAHPGCGIVHSDLVIIDEAGDPIAPDWYLRRTCYLAQGHCLIELLSGCHIQVPTVMERRDCFEAAGGFDTRFCRAEDYLHWIEALLHGYSIGYLDQPLAQYRCRSSSLSRNYLEMSESIIRMFQVLMKEKGLMERIDPTQRPRALEVLSAHLARVRKGLPYQYRQQGRRCQARRQALGLIRDFPREKKLYAEFLKSCLPEYVAQVWGRMRQMLA